VLATGANDAPTTSLELLAVELRKERVGATSD
jgi:hypothetical protein